jgi:ATP-binding cassette, subfamily C, bacteriocin exporter
MRYPIIHQHDASDCGPAVLAMISAYHNVRVSIARCRELAGTDRTGTNLAGLSSAAEQIGYSTRAVRATAGALERVPLPAVAHFHNHFVVLYEATTRRVIVGDPARGLRRLKLEEFQKNWTGVLLLLTPTPRLRDSVRSGSDFSRLYMLLLPHSHLFLDALFAAVLMTILALTSSFFIQALVDVVFVLGRKPALNWLGLGMLLVTLARAVFQGLRSCLLARLSQRIDAETVLGYHRHLLGLPLAFFLTRRKGEILSRINDAARIRAAIGAATLSAVTDVFAVLTAAGLMLWLNWKLTLQSLLLVPVWAAGIWLLNRPMKPHQRRALERNAEVEALMTETVGAIREIKAFRSESRTRLKTEARFAEMQEASMDAQMFSVYASTLSSMVVGVSTLGLLWLGGHRVMDGEMTAGQLLALYSMLGIILEPIERLATANEWIQDAIAASGRLGEVLQLAPEAAKEKQHALDRTLDGAVEFQNVTFGCGSGQPALEKLSFRIAPGECAAITLEKGSSRTALADLLVRFFDPSSGHILIDGIDIRDYGVDCLRREISFVSEDIVLFNASIADNIRLARPSATAAEIRTAAETAGIRRGYDTLVGEQGVSLSTTERRQIGVARAILMDPAILILDEFSESASQALLEHRRGRRTTILIHETHLCASVSLCSSFLCLHPSSNTNNP